jgi:hypothetical protein
MYASALRPTSLSLAEGNPYTHDAHNYPRNTWCLCTAAPRDKNKNWQFIGRNSSSLQTHWFERNHAMLRRLPDVPALRQGHMIGQDHTSRVVRTERRGPGRGQSKGRFLRTSCAFSTVATQSFCFRNEQPGPVSRTVNTVTGAYERSFVSPAYPPYHSC